jgi:hypothetical protein
VNPRKKSTDVILPGIEGLIVLDPVVILPGLVIPNMGKRSKKILSSVKNLPEQNRP